MEGQWKGTKSQRSALRDKFGGRCGYCGQKLNKMHADHIHPIRRITCDPYGKTLPRKEQRMINPDLNVASNMMPACAPCNLSKGGYSLEEWRMLLMRGPAIVEKEKSIFRAAIRFGLVSIIDKPVVFHFENVATPAQKQN